MIKSRMISDKLKKYEGRNVIVFGAGEIGKQVVECLKENNIHVEAIFDNDETKQGKKLCGIQIEAPVNKKGDRHYIIANNDYITRKRIAKQLLNLGISCQEISTISIDDAIDYWESLSEEKYQEEISQLYYETFEEKMDWENPQKFNEIINYEKLYSDDIDKRTALSDKYLVRQYVKEKIGEQYLVKLLGVWDTSDEIDFDRLPKSFVLKTNNGSGRNIIVKDKSKIDIEEICETLDYWLKKNYGYQELALQYKGIVPKIICEEYLEGLAETSFDYDVFCFHGKPQYIWCIRGSHRKNACAAFYDTSWGKKSFSYGYPFDSSLIKRPEELEQILELSRLLCTDFKHVRVDWYIMPEGRIYFSELTFATWGGLKKFNPSEWDEIFGRAITEDI